MRGGGGLMKLQFTSMLSRHVMSDKEFGHMV